MEIVCYGREYNVEWTESDFNNFCKSSGLEIFIKIPIQGNLCSLYMQIRIGKTGLHVCDGYKDTCFEVQKADKW